MQFENISKLCQTMSLKRVGLILTIFFSIFVLPRVVDSQEEGFTSIDCGGDHDFIDPDTNISWTSDMNLPGEELTLPETNNSTLPLGYDITQELTTVRSFSTGKKNCYPLSAITGTKYLLRLRFWYGNFDLQNRGNGYTMKIIIDTDVISEVSPTNDIETREFVLTALSETISVCLGRIEDPPYINSIELRKLDPHMYPTVTANKILIVYHIYPYSDVNMGIIRYPQDKHDRFWRPSHVRNVTQVNTTMSIGDGNSTEKVPSVVMRNAVQNDISIGITFTFTGPQRLETECAFYFAAFKKENEKPEISIVGSFDANLPVSVAPFHMQFNNAIAILFKSIYAAQSLRITFTKDRESSEPVILNAWRYSSVHYRSGKKTNQTDIEVMSQIKGYFNITKLWTGDPCLPINYTWDKVGCDYDGPSARVSSVDLSEMNLHMKLNSRVQDYFTQLDSLCLLNLSNNNLKGNLANSLFKPPLETDYSKNPHLHRKGLTTKEKNIVMITVVPISAIAMVIVFLIWRHVLGKMSKEHMEEKREEPETQSEGREEPERQSEEKSAWRVPWLPPVSNNEHTKEEKKREEHNPPIVQHDE